ncbi:MAG: LysR family transcriptional regulator [Rhodobacterales bacterium]|nr:LysR family transcriptional regulator [Rhodobacterales bacterium]
MSLSIAAMNALRTVAETGSCAAAARRLDLSQPAVSQQAANRKTIMVWCC